MISRYLPRSATHVMAVAQLLAGATLGWVTHPLLWIAQPLPIWLANIAATAAQESAYDSEALGDGGSSYGLLQFNAPVAAEMFGPSWPTAVLSPWRQGYAAARYVQGALTENVRWWLILVPVYGFAMLRWMWTSGRSDASAKAALSGDGASGDTAWSRFREEERSGAAYVLWTVLIFTGAGLIYTGWRMRQPKARGGRRARRR